MRDARVVVVTKRCAACGAERPLSDFYKKSTSRDGYRHKCKSCWAKDTREYRADRRDEVHKWASYNAVRYSSIRKPPDAGSRARDLERKRIYRIAHPGKMRRVDAKYRAEHASIRRAQDARRRAAKRDAPGSFCANQWKRIVAHYSPTNRCLHCGKVSILTVDHVVPLSRGGSNYPSNLQPLCISCNLRKHTHAKDYRPDKGTYAAILDS